MERHVKQERNNDKDRNLMGPANRNKIQMMKKVAESDEEEGGETREPQQQKYGKFGLRNQEKNMKEGKYTGK